MLDEVVDLFRNIIEAKGLKLKIDLEDSIDNETLIYSDKQRVK